MNLWNLAAVVLLISLLPCGWVVARGVTTMDRLVALEFASAVGVSLFLVLAEGLRQPILQDLALVTSVLALPSGLVFTYFLERWP